MGVGSKIGHLGCGSPAARLEASFGFTATNYRAQWQGRQGRAPAALGAKARGEFEMAPEQLAPVLRQS